MKKIKERIKKLKDDIKDNDKNKQKIIDKISKYEI